MTGCNMTDLDKNGVKKERDLYKKEYEHMSQWNDELQAENNLLKQKVANLEKEKNEIIQKIETEFIPDYQSKIDRIKELEAMLEK